MSQTWKRSLLVALTVLFSVLFVVDVQAGIFRRRRVRSNTYTGYSTSGSVYGTVGASADAGVAAPGVGVAAPGVGVTVGPRGASVNAPGANVDAGVNRAGPGGRIRGGANVTTPGANVRAGANLSAPPVGADANLRVRGQTPDDASTGPATPLPPPVTPQVP